MKTPLSKSQFSDSDLIVLHSMVEMFQKKDDRDQFRILMNDGATLTDIVAAYRAQKYLMSFLKAAAGLVVICGGAIAVLKGFGLWPWK